MFQRARLDQPPQLPPQLTHVSQGNLPRRELRESGCPRCSPTVPPSTVLRISCAFALFQTRQTLDSSRAGTKPQRCGCRASGARPVRWASSWPVVCPASTRLHTTHWWTRLELSLIYHRPSVCFIIYENTDIQQYCLFLNTGSSTTPSPPPSQASQWFGPRPPLLYNS